MTMSGKVLVFAILALGAARGAPAQTLAERLASAYTAVTSMTCTVRREVVSDGREALHLSRVWFARPDRLRVESSLPVARKIVADGADLYYHIAGDARGLKRPIPELREDMRLEIRRVPGTPMEHLLRLLGLPETALPPAEGWPVRAGYDTGRAYLVLSLDGNGRLGRVEVFDGPALEKRLGRYDYGSYREIVPGVWLACRQESCFQYDGREVREVIRIENPVVNGGIPVEMFEAGPVFPGVVFTPEGDPGL
jgi:hypothetical protein